MEGYKMSLTARRSGLKKLIEDAVTLKFSEKVIKSYREQLVDIESQIKEIKLERERFKANNGN